MIARRYRLTHPHAGDVDLPLLVPAFSSKGFPFIRRGKSNKTSTYSGLANALIEFPGYSRVSVLVSAFDIYHRHFVPPEGKDEEVFESLRNCRVVFVDSGGYELASEFDSTEVKSFQYKPKIGFGSGEYEQVLNVLKKPSRKLHCVIANFDHRTKGLRLHEQIQRARTLFVRYPDFMSDFIIKPFSRTGKIIDFGEFKKSDFANLKGFGIIGVTEKELGSKLADRVKNIALLRKGLTEAGIGAPIHVWGGLDPIISPLYFFAGAEIFDGVSWLRYAYKDGVAINRESNSVLEAKIGISASADLSRRLTCIDNLQTLDGLSVALQQWVDFDGENFDMFHANVKERLKAAHTSMQTMGIS
jgi:hypothetical protein